MENEKINDINTVTRQILHTKAALSHVRTWIRHLGHATTIASSYAGCPGFEPFCPWDEVYQDHSEQLAVKEEELLQAIKGLKSKLHTLQGGGW